MSPAPSNSSSDRRHHAGPLQVLALVNQKGGCGKTTTAVNLAGALVDERVLLVDLDPQAHATMAVGIAPEGPTLAEVLLEEAYIEQAIVEGPLGLHLLPSRARLVEFEEASERLLHAEQRLQHALDAVRDRYDFVVLDCPPRADGVLCANALFACTGALLVVETGAFALQGRCRPCASSRAWGRARGGPTPCAWSERSSTAASALRASC